MFGIPSLHLYLALLGLLILERLVELAITRRNARRLRARGGIEVGERHYPWMVLLHTALLVACPLEVWLLERPFVPPLALAMLLLLAGTMALRYWAIRSLGDRWTTQVFVVPGEAAVQRGPYRFLRHPNYVAVVVEVLALPLVHTAWLSAIVFSLGNILVLRERIRVEERALAEHSGWERDFGHLPRFLPRPGPARSEEE